MRGAHRQQRACYLYAFSGPQDVQELDLKMDAGSLGQLLDFLKHSFGGGTDVDRPLELSLDRLEKKEWAQVRGVHCCSLVAGASLRLVQPAMCCTDEQYCVPCLLAPMQSSGTPLAGRLHVARLCFTLMHCWSSSNADRLVCPAWMHGHI